MLFRNMISTTRAKQTVGVLQLDLILDQQYCTQVKSCVLCRFRINFRNCESF